MQITRHNHLHYMARITPLLIVLYVAQMIIYQKYAPAHLSGDMNLFLGIGLAFIILCYQFYDHHHQIIFRENYLEVRFDILKMKEEILYQNIVHLELKKKRDLYGLIIVYQKDGSMFQLHNVDSPELIIEYIEKKKAKRI